MTNRNIKYLYRRLSLGKERKPFSSLASFDDNAMRNLKSQISNLKSALRGFTLIETLVAVLLLTLSITGPLTLASKGLSAALIARDQMIAFYLAQEAVEYVHYVRDSNKLATASWLTGLDNCTTATGCYIDTTAQPPTITVCSASGCPLINKHTSGGSTYFSYTAGTVTPQQFRRTILLSTPSTGEVTEEVLTVSVSWRAQSGVTRSISVSSNFMDWQ